MEETHYEVLNVSENATSEQIKFRFQNLILRHHPDKRGSVPQDDDQAQRILRAWDVLRTPQSRKEYDAELAARQRRQGAVINSEIDLDDMAYNEDKLTFSMRCRCSGTYAITEDDLEQGIDVVCCDNCSLRIRVLYDVVEGDDE
ncbi:hypothetical protein BDB00DRAFT_817588 [Zychaea mexicana]|uniref:uncharacterized protein n=1 Tax=Zychaea mexicana TaxID=64656 RepID=UPI0022FDBC64|nr:uncharacterized protein BDB00DRAFT_817588 [Zychaea mexicana]KAI9494627.1 hypothetical protein BDB00DRAFT_817588 [Zychaea mexicana]